MTTHFQERPKTGHERNIEGEARMLLRRIGPYDSVERFISNYAKMTTRKMYLYHLDRYLAWLHESGVTLTPDELITDNLRCIFESGAIEVVKKRTLM
jgi:hypothetical protein